MSRRCVMCGQDQGNNLAVFPFPKSQHQKALWLMEIQQIRPTFRLPQERESYSSQSQIGVCEKHFLPQDIKKGKRRSLQHKAVPIFTGADCMQLRTNSKDMLGPEFVVSGNETENDSYLISDAGDAFRSVVSRKHSKSDIWDVNDADNETTCLSIDLEDYLQSKSSYIDSKQTSRKSKDHNENTEVDEGKDICLVCGHDSSNSTLVCILQLDARCEGLSASVSLSRIVSKPKIELTSVSRKICSRCTNLVQEVQHMEEDLKAKKQTIRTMYNTTFQNHFVSESSSSKSVTSYASDFPCKITKAEELGHDTKDVNLSAKDSDSTDHVRKSSRRQASTKRFCCPQCKEVFSSLALWVHHLSKHQETEESAMHKVMKPTKSKGKKVKVSSHACDECGKKFMCKQTLLAHSASHQKATECSICGRYLTTKARLKVHLFKFHGIGEEKNKEIECTDCGKCFGTKAGLRYHRNVVHQVGIKYVCEHCDKTFYYHVPYRSHLLHAHGEKKIVCETCGEKFFTVSKLNTHINAVHRSAESWMCEKCQTKFTTYTAYRHHMNVKHLKIQHSCDYCSAQFRKKSSLVVHLWKHSVYLCQLCQERCPGPEELKTHMSCVHGKDMVWKGKMNGPWAGRARWRDKRQVMGEATLQQKSEENVEIQPNEHVASIVINDLIMTAESYDNNSLQSFSLSACEKLPEKQNYEGDDMKVKSLDIIDTTQELSSVEHMQFSTVETLEIKSSPDDMAIPSGVSLINVQILGDMEISQTDDLGDLKGTMLADAADHLTHDSQMDGEDNMTSQLQVQMHHLSEEDLVVDNDLTESNHTLEPQSIDSSCHLKVDDLDNTCHLQAPNSLENSCHLEGADLENCLTNSNDAEPRHCGDIQRQLEPSSLPEPSHLSSSKTVGKLDSVDSLSSQMNKEPSLQVTSQLEPTDQLSVSHQCSLPALISRQDEDEMTPDISTDLHNITPVDEEMTDQVEENMGQQIAVEINPIAEMDSAMVEQEDEHMVSQLNSEISRHVEQSYSREGSSQHIEMDDSSLGKEARKIEGVELEPFSVSLDNKCEVQYQYVMYISADGEDTQAE